jgi:uncharacterized membrane protein
MTTVEASVEVDAPADRAWEVVSDPTNLPQWDRHIVGVDGVPAEGLEVGTEYRVHLRFMAVRAVIFAKVLEIRHNEYARLRLRGIVEATVENWVKPIAPNRTMLRHRVEYRFRGGFLGELAARAVNVVGAGVMLRRGTLAQKRQIESRRPGDA